MRMLPKKKNLMSCCNSCTPQKECRVVDALEFKSGGYLIGCRAPFDCFIIIFCLPRRKILCS